MDMVVEIKQFRLTPRKIEPKKIYTFQNDAESNYLSEQLCTIQDFNLRSREQIYTKAEEFKRAIDEKTAKLKRLSDEKVSTFCSAERCIPTRKGKLDVQGLL